MIAGILTKIWPWGTTQAGPQPIEPAVPAVPARRWLRTTTLHQDTGVALDQMASIFGPQFDAGSATPKSKPTLGSGTNLGYPEPGALEFDGTAFYETIDTASGRGQTNNQQIFRLAANGSALGPTISDYFGAGSALPTVTNGVYLLNFCLFFLKSTAGTVTITITNTSVYTNIAAWRYMSNASGIGTGAAGAAGIVTTTTAAAALPATGSLTDAVNHTMIVGAIAEVATLGNIRLQITCGTGTATPLRGSYYTAQRLFAGNVGTFVA